MATETTVRITNKTYEEVEALVYGADLTFDLLVHGRQDGSSVCVTGEGDVLATITRLGMTGEVVMWSNSSVITTVHEGSPDEALVAFHAAAQQAVEGRLAALRAASTPQERNELAVELADDDIPGVGGAILDLLASPSTAGSRGTLVYALGLLPRASVPEGAAEALRKMSGDEAESEEARWEAEALLERLEDKQEG
jgi:hypothetical protein